MGISHSLRVVLPKVLGLTVAMPLLVLWTSALAIGGGMLVAASQLDLSPGYFIETLPRVVVVDDSGIQAGSLTSAGGYRVRRCEEIALQQKLPFVHLVESAGANLLKYRVEQFIHGRAEGPIHMDVLKP